STPSKGGVGTAGAGSTGTLQIGYQQEQWGLAAIYTSVQNTNQNGEPNGLMAFGTQFVLDSYNNPGTTSAFGLSGYWQPETSGWIPSISAGWGYNATSYDSTVLRSVDQSTLVTASQSWTVALEWNDVVLKGNNAGMAVGQPMFATELESGDTPRDGNYIWEWWYQFQVTDNISVTPALFYLSRPFGQETPADTTFNQLGGLVKTTFSF
ncbi:porin, partial [Pseudomonas sp. HMWF031]